jgi:hypothetical protein
MRLTSSRGKPDIIDWLSATKINEQFLWEEPSCYPKLSLISTDED